MALAVPGARAPALELPRLGGGTVEVPGSAELSLVVFYKAGCP